MKQNIRRTIYLLLGRFDQMVGNENRLVIYCYHNISSNPWAFHVSKSLFEKHMETLTNWGQPIKLEDIGKFIKGEIKLPKKAFAVTFDDGYKGILNILPIVNKLNISPTVFVLADKNNLDRKEMATSSEVLSKSEIKTLIKAGFEIGSHGLSHKTLLGSEQVNAHNEINNSKKILEKKLGQKIRYFSYPHGKHNTQINNLVKNAGYSFGFSMDDKKISSSIPHYAVPRVGVLNNHTNEELLYLASPSVLLFRRLVKKTPLRRFI